MKTSQMFFIVGNMYALVAGMMIYNAYPEIPQLRISVIGVTVLATVCWLVLVVLGMKEEGL